MALGQVEQEQVRQRVEAIVRLLLQGDSVPNIVQMCAKSWGVKSRQVYYYVRRARTLIRKEAERIRKEAFNEHLAARRRMRKDAFDGDDKRLAFDILKDESKLLGLYPAEKQEVKHEGEVHIVKVIEGLDEDEL